MCVYLNAGHWAVKELKVILPGYLASPLVFCDLAAAGAGVWAGLQGGPPAVASHWSLVVVLEQAVPFF